MKALLVMVFALGVCSAEGKDPKKMDTAKGKYLAAVTKAEKSFDKKKLVATKAYIADLRKGQEYYMGKKDLDRAIACKTEADRMVALLKAGTPAKVAKKPEVAAKKPAPGTRVSKVILYQATNGKAGNVGTHSGTVRFYLRGKEVKSQKFTLKWIVGKNTRKEIKLAPSLVVDKVRIECETTRKYAGLAEISIMSTSGKDLALKGEISVDSELNAHTNIKSKLTDKSKDSSLMQVWCSRGAAGWIEVKF